MTTRLRNILDDYPSGVGPFKEFLQNADDARARRFALVLDYNTYATKELFSPALAQWQGPALLIYNSAFFSEGDFDNIVALGRSEFPPS